AEEGAALAELSDLRRLALAEVSALAHEAVAAGDVERHHHPVARLDVAHTRADLLDDAHRIVADDVPGLHEHAEHRVTVQVRAADRRGGDAYDLVGRLLEFGVGDVVAPNVLLPVPSRSLHLTPSLLPLMA